MSNVRKLPNCPVCFGRLLPMSVCQTCGSELAQAGLEEIGPDMSCEDCGAVNPTQFVCSACNTRFPYREVVRPEGRACPMCKAPVPAGAQLCPTCSAVLPPEEVPGGRSRRRIRGEYTPEDILEVARIPGVGRQRAESLCAAGFNALWKIARAPTERLARVKGLGGRTAAQIKDSVRFLLPGSRAKSKEEVLSEECICPMCSVVTSLFTSRCHECGAGFDEEDVDEEFRDQIQKDEDRALLAYYDVRLLERPDDLDLHYARGILLTSMGRPADALGPLDRVLEHQPTNRRVLLAKARALAASKGYGNAAQVLREAVMRRPSVPPEAEAATVEQVMKTLEALAIEECPECGERQVPGATACPVCGHRFVPGEAPSRPPKVDEQLLKELEHAMAGEEKAPPPPLRGEVPEAVVAEKRAMRSFLGKVLGVSEGAAEAVAGFFQNLEQIGLSDVASLAAIPGVTKEEARLIKTAVDEYLAPPPPEAPAEKVVQPVARMPTVRAPPPERRPPPPAPSAPEVVAPRPREAAPSKPPAVARRALEFPSRRGLVNGKGLVNGRGRVNGLVNGTGFINGTVLAQPRLPRRAVRSRVIAIVVSLALLVTIAVGLSLPEPAPSILIDGDFGDWQGIPGYSDATSTTNPDVQIVSTYVSYDLGYMFFRIDVAGTIFSDAAGYDTAYVFIDDVGRTTGYDLGDLSAEYLVLVNGRSGAAGDAALMEFEGAQRDDWHGWGEGEPASAAARGSGIEIAVSAWEIRDLCVNVEGEEVCQLSQLRVRFVLDDNEWNACHTNVPIPIAPFGALRVTQHPLTSIASYGTQAFLEIEFEAIGTGSRLDVSGVLLEYIGNANLFTDNIPAQFTVAQGSPVTYTVNVNPTGLAAGAIVEARVARMFVEERPYAIMGPKARAYVDSAPTVKRIDGLFADWAGAYNDGDPTPVARPALDVERYDGSVTGSSVFLYAKLGGDVLEGSIVPQRVSPPGPGGGGGGGGPGPTLPPLIGRDHLRFYLSTDAAAPYGPVVNGLPADRCVEVLGRFGVVVDASLYRWSGTNWTREGDVLTALAETEIEAAVTVAANGFNATRLVLVTGDWSGDADVTNVEATRAGTRGGTGPAPFDISGNGKFWFRDTNHATETDCTENKVASSTMGSGPMRTITLDPGEHACWYVDSTTGATIPAGDWEVLLDISRTGSADYSVSIEIWNLDTNNVAETIGSWPDQVLFGDDQNFQQTGVAEKTLSSNQVVRVYIAHAAAGDTISIDYDDSDSSGDSRATLPIPEFSDIVFPIVAVAVGFVAVRRSRRRGRSGC